ncbi:MAG: DUF2974 domain-containing protein [Clostridia bacterium]|nr:DUF2974 domain-containing protein [Clostridia bacterium]
MANIIDYVLWRGDLPFDQVPAGEVDALILSYLAYMPFDDIVGEAFDAQDVLLGDAAREILARHEAGELPLAFSPREDKRLLQAVSESLRFGGLRLCGFVHRFDVQREEQFCALTCLPAHGPAIVAFRGTDKTVVGWKEDFNMCYSGVVPAQRSALLYAGDAAATLSRPLILCGHSKGGNLAAYASIFAGKETQDAIACVYNFDGPGFNEEVIGSEEFARVDMRIRVFVPQASMVGILLWHSEPFTVVRSEGVSVLQHLPYHWKVMGGSLLVADGLSGDSRLAEITLKHWLQSLSPELRRQVIDGIYSVLSVSDGHKLSDLFEPRNVLAIIRAAGAMEEETRAALVEAFRLLGSTLRETLPDFIDEKTDELRLRAMKDRNENE